MNILRESEIKLIEKLEEFRSNGQCVEQKTGLEKNRDKMFQQKKDVKEEIEIIEKLLGMKEEYTENRQPIEQIFVVDESEAFTGDVKQLEKNERLEGKNCLKSEPHSSSDQNEVIEKKKLTQVCCTCCYLNFESKEELKIHLKSYLKRKFKCVYCNYSSNLKYSFDLHMKRHSEKKLFKCSQCRFETNSKNSLPNHMLTHSNVKLYKCSDCVFECNYKFSLKTHMLRHTNVKLFKCSYCSYEGNFKRGFEKHMSTHAKTSSSHRQ